MNNYIDKYGRYHDKQVTELDPIPSNNSWFYTALAQKLDLYIDRSKLSVCAEQCEVGNHWVRTPGDDTPPMSRDEILGMVHLGYITAGDLIYKDWNFSPHQIPRFNILKTIQAALRLKDAHRNALWQNGGEPHMFRFAFSVPIQDRAWILERAGFKVPLTYRIWNYVSRKKKSDNISSRMIDWLKYGDKPDLALFEATFGKDHIFSRQLRQD